MQSWRCNCLRYLNRELTHDTTLKSLVDPSQSHHNSAADNIISTPTTTNDRQLSSQHSSVNQYISSDYTTMSGPITAAAATATMPRAFFDLPEELRNRIYELVDDDTTISTSDWTLNMPKILWANSQLRREYLPVFVGSRRITIDLYTRGNRVNTAFWLFIFGHVMIDNAREIIIILADESTPITFHARLHVALGRRTVSRCPSPNMGNVRVGNAHVIFESPADRLHHQVSVARQVATATNSILTSHGPNAQARINVQELKQLVGVLHSANGVRLGGLSQGGLGGGWTADHVEDGAFADFWAMAEQ